MLTKLSDLSPPWRLLLSLVAGGLASAALAPLFLLPLLYLAFCLFGLLCFSTDHPKQAFREGFAFGFGYFLTNIYWLPSAFILTPFTHAWLVPLAIPLIAAVLALATALPPALAVRIPALYPRALALILLLSTGEWLRGYIFQFPWNNFAQGFGFSSIILQPLSVLGRDGYSLLVIASLVLFPLAIARPQKRWLIHGIAFSIPLLFALWGLLRLDKAPDIHQNFWSNAGVRIVQPNITQQDKINHERAGENLSKLIDLSFQDLPGWVGHVIWPETSLHLLIDDYSPLLQDLGSLLPAGGALITGTMRKAGQKRYYNSAIAIHDNGARTNLHDKVTMLPIMGCVADIHGGRFSSGQNRSAHSVGLLPNFSTLICEEAIFSGLVKPQAQNTQWLLNLTDDAGFDQTSGSYQHAAIARWRAIEEGLPLVRVANTGKSIVYDAYGRILAERPLGVEATINIRIPKPLESPTFFSNNPNTAWVVLLVFLASLFIVVWYVETRPRLRFEL